MVQLGCFKASSTVAFLICCPVHVLKGPPDAVNQILESSLVSALPPKDWNIAECSLSTGTMRAPYWRSMGMMAAPAATRVSLLARAIVFPFLIAAAVGFNPRNPT